MTPKKTTFALALAAVIGALVIAGCGGGGESTTTTEAASSGGGEGTPAKAEGTSSSGTIGTASIGGLGTVLVDSKGMTVYEFTVDSGTTSNCYGSCESLWPPVIAKGKPTAGKGAMSSALGTTKRKDGTIQVTYNGHPLYTYAADSAPGEANGNEIEGTWFVLNSQGAAVKGKATGETESKSGSEESSGGYGGY
ncbi:MAG: hypothetical protein JSU06_12975 [Actinobacteria bacterium]|nr:hypothetical protein [Actinomycetota bacterium]